METATVEKEEVARVEAGTEEGGKEEGAMGGEETAAVEKESIACFTMLSHVPRSLSRGMYSVIWGCVAGCGGCGRCRGSCVSLGARGMRASRSV